MLQTITPFMLSLPLAGLAYLVSRLASRVASARNWIPVTIVALWLVGIVLSVFLASALKVDSTGLAPGMGVEGEDTDVSRQIIVVGFWVALLSASLGSWLGWYQTARAGRRASLA